MKPLLGSSMVEYVKLPNGRTMRLETQFACDLEDEVRRGSLALMIEMGRHVERAMQDAIEVMGKIE